jgi:hypothetical protein
LSIGAEWQLFVGACLLLFSISNSGAAKLGLKQMSESIVGVQDRRIAAAAQMTGKSPLQLVSLLARDSSAFLTSSGALSYGCSLNSPHDHMLDAATFHSAATSATIADVTPGPAVADADFADGLDPAQAFHMHSRRGALKTIFLQFQGCKTIVSSVYMS